MDLVIGEFLPLQPAPPALAAGGAEPESFVPDVAFADVLDRAAGGAPVAAGEGGDVASGGCGLVSDDSRDVGRRDSLVAVAEGGERVAGAASVTGDEDEDPVVRGTWLAAGETGEVALLNSEASRHPPARDGGIATADAPLDAAADAPDDEPDERGATMVLWQSAPVPVSPVVEVSVRHAVPADVDLNVIDGASRDRPAKAEADVVGTRETAVAAPRPEPRDSEAPRAVNPTWESHAIAAEGQTVDTHVLDQQRIDRPTTTVERELPVPRAARSLAWALARLNGESASRDAALDRQNAVEPQALMPPGGGTGTPDAGSGQSAFDTLPEAHAPASQPAQPPQAPRVSPSLDVMHAAHGLAVAAVPQSVLAATLPTAPSPTLDARSRAPEDRDIVPQLVRAMRTQFRAGIGEARIRLHPEHLGEVWVSVRIDGGRVSAVLQVERADVQRAIESQSETLRAGLTAQGFTLEHLSVRQEEASPPPAREDADARGQPREQAAPQRRARKKQPDREFELEL